MSLDDNKGYSRLWRVAKVDSTTQKKFNTAKAGTIAWVAAALISTWAQAQEWVEIPQNILDQVSVIQKQPNGSQIRQGGYLLEKLLNGNVNVYQWSTLLYSLWSSEMRSLPDEIPASIGSRFQFNPTQQWVWGTMVNESGSQWSARVWNYSWKWVTADVWFGTELSQNMALAINIEWGAQLQRFLATLGFSFENGVLMFSGEHLWVKDTFSFSSGDVEKMVRQNSFWTVLKVYFSEDIVKSLEVSWYITKAQSYQLANKEYSVNTNGIFTIYDNFRNISGGEKKWVQAKVNFAVWQNGELSLWVNYESLSYNNMYSPNEKHSQVWGVVGYTHNFDKNTRGNIELRTWVSSNSVQAWVSRILDNGATIWVVARHTHAKHGANNDTYVGVQYTMPFGWGSSSRDVSRYNSSDQRARAQVSPLVWEVVAQNASFRSSGTLHKVDQKSERILQIDTNQIPEWFNINEKWEILVSQVNVTSINSILRNGAPHVNSGEFAIVWTTFVIKTRDIQEPPAWVVHTYDINLSKVGWGFVNLSIQVVAGSIIIKSITIEEIDEALVDKESLNTTILSAQSLQESDYTPSSWVSFMAILNHAIAISENTSATQDEVNNALVQLQDAITNLTEKADFSALSTKIIEAKNIYNTGSGVYTHESLVNLNQAIIVAEDRLANQDSTQDEINQAINLLNWAIQALEAEAVWPTDAEKVATARDNLTIAWDLNNVISNLTLVTSQNEASVSWVSSNELVISNTWVVTRPANGSGNAMITLTATLQVWSETLTKEFTITVLEAEPVAPLTPTLSINSWDTHTRFRDVNINIGNDSWVDAWYVSESSSTPDVWAWGWSSTEPTSYTLSDSDGVKTLYVWTKKDGVVSMAASDTITLDRIAPTVDSVWYSDTGPTNQDVTVTVTLNEAWWNAPVWWVKTGSNTYTKTYSSNTSENVTFRDLAGNTVIQNISVNNIDKVAPTKTWENFSTLDTKWASFTWTMTFNENVTLISASIAEWGSIWYASGNGTPTLSFSGVAPNADTATLTIVVEDQAGNQTTVNLDSRDLY